MSEAIEQLQSWYNNNLAFANTSGLMSALFVFVLGVMSRKAKANENAVRIDVGAATEEMKQLMSVVGKLVDNQKQAEESINKLSNMIMIGFNGTKVPESVKLALNKEYASISEQYDRVKKSTDTFIDKVVDESKEIIADLAPETQDMYSRLKKSTKKDR